MGQASFWDNPDGARTVVTEMKALKALIDPLEAMMRDIGDVRALRELGEEVGDQASLEEADRQLTDLEARGQRVELQSLLDGKNDPLNCFVQIHAGAGGVEAQDWAEMLLRMYLKYFERR